MGANLPGAGEARDSSTMARPPQPEHRGRAFFFARRRTSQPQDTALHQAVDRLLGVAPLLTTFFPHRIRVEPFVYPADGLPVKCKATSVITAGRYLAERVDRGEFPAGPGGVNVLIIDADTILHEQDLGFRETTHRDEEAKAAARGLRGVVLQSLTTYTTNYESATSPTTTDRRTSRRLLGLDDGNPLCLSMGRLAREKNLAFLLHAVRHIVRALPAARLVLVGGGDERLPLERLARDVGLRSGVRFVGAVPRERVEGYTRAADLFLCPSTSETQGLAALEALAAGVPVIAVASDAATDLLQGESAGVLCPENPEAFAEAVATLWEAPERRLAMADAGRRLAARFTPEASAAALLDLYAELLRARRLAPAAARSDALRSTEART